MVKTGIKVAAFFTVMALLTAALFFVFGQYRTGATSKYSAVFTDVSSLKAGDSVRFAGIRVGTVTGVDLRRDKTVLVAFDADRDVVLTVGTKAAVRYLNLVGDRFLELVDDPGSTQLLASGAQIPIGRTVPALDLDLLLSGLKPVVRGLNPQDVNALTSSLLEIFQDQGQSAESLFARVSTLSNSLADNNQTIESLIDNLRSALGTLATNGDKFAGLIDRLQRVATDLSTDRDTIGDAIEALDQGTASMSDLLTRARPPLAGTIDQLNRLAPALDNQKDKLEAALQKAPENYRKLVRLGSYGSFINYYICGVTFRVTDLQGKTASFPWIKQENGRCAEP